MRTVRPLPTTARRRATRAWLCLAAVLLSAAAIADPHGAGDAAPSLVVLGDSLSAGYGIRLEQGWVALLARRLATEGYGYRVVNASVSGETSSGGRARLARVLAVQRPAVVIVELGANDGLRGLPVAELRQNLAAIVTDARAAGARVLLVGMRLPGNYGPEYTAQFQAAFASAAKAGGAALVPFLLERIAANEANFQADRLHPIAAVQDQLLDTVWPVLRPLLARRRADSPPRKVRR